MNTKNMRHMMVELYKSEKDLWLYKIRELNDYTKGRIIGRLEMAYIFGAMTTEEYEQERFEIMSIDTL